LQDALDDVIAAKQTIEEEVFRVLEENTELTALVNKLQNTISSSTATMTAANAVASDSSYASTSTNPAGTNQHKNAYPGDLAFSSYSASKLSSTSVTPPAKLKK
jgi:hypothetical protein